MHCFKTEEEALAMSVAFHPVKFVVVALEVETPWYEDVLKEDDNA